MTIEKVPKFPPYTNQYNLRTLPEFRHYASRAIPADASAAEAFAAPPEASPDLPPLWSGKGFLETPPAIGARVYARGGFGWSAVAGYFVEHGFLGLQLKPEILPDWFRRQNPGRQIVRLFGAEIEAESLLGKKI